MTGANLQMGAIYTKTSILCPFTPTHVIFEPTETLLTQITLMCLIVFRMKNFRISIVSVVSCIKNCIRNNIYNFERSLENWIPCKKSLATDN